MPEPEAIVVGDIRYTSPTKFELRYNDGPFAGEWLKHEATPETADFIRQQWERQQKAGSPVTNRNVSD